MKLHIIFRIIQQWLFTGILYDPYCELFIVKHDVSGGSRLHWNTCYTIVDKDTPAFLKSISSEILNCGKNLQLLRDCDPTVSIRYYDIIIGMFISGT